MNAREFFDRVSEMRRLQRLAAVGESFVSQCREAEAYIDKEIKMVNIIIAFKEKGYEIHK